MKPFQRGSMNTVKDGSRTHWNNWNNPSMP